LYTAPKKQQSLCAADLHKPKCIQKSLKLSLSRNATGREFQRHGPASEKQNNIYKAYSYTINENNKLQEMAKVDISDKIND